ncbi:MAG: GTP 3',8-cyclase MoaA [Myxococcales bacterium]|nr:GTP 3',8-cyclase MoaA [Myxococcales bacterium]
MARNLPVVPSPEPLPERPPPRAVRLSITDRCDMACVYCRPGRRDAMLAAERRLGVDDFEALVRGLVAAGVRRVRLTGGEPLIHPRIVQIVRQLAAIPGVEDLALTTNGSQLGELAQELREAGLMRLNVSLDSLDPNRFFRLTRGGRLDDVLAGIERARAVGFDDIKLNTVVLAGENDRELPAIVQWAWRIGATPRLLELMRVGEGARWEGHIPYTTIRERVAHLIAPGETARDADRGPARYASARDGVHRVGFITGESESFCAGCDRLRVSSDGRLRPCLATDDYVGAAREARRGDLEGIGARLGEAWAMKPDGATWRGCAEEAARRVDMRSTGG